MTKTWLSRGLIAAFVAVGCGETPEPSTTTPTGEGGDTGQVSPLCMDLGGANAGMTDPGFPTIPGGRAGFSQFPPVLPATVTAASVAPPAISGGTLRISADGKIAVAADPDRDQVYVVDLAARSVRATIKLAAGDEPGRVVLDGANRAHVALRHGGAIVSIDTVAGTSIERRNVCASPRGVAYDATSDLIHVACSDGELVSLPAAGGAAVRSLTLDRDLRDIVVSGGHLYVSRFRSAEVLTVEADGTVSSRVVPKAFRSASVRGGQQYTASTAWKMEAAPDGEGVVMLHQRGVVDEVQPVIGGYGGSDTCSGIVHPTVTVVTADGQARSGPALAGLTLAVDMAVSHNGGRVAMVAPGNSSNQFPTDTGPDLTRVFMTEVDDVTTTDSTFGCMPDGMHAPCPPTFKGGGILFNTDDPMATGLGGSTGTAGSTGGEVPPVTCNGQPDPNVPQVVGEPIAVAFDGSDNLVVQSREPAMLAFRDGGHVTLSADSRFDTGHFVFHANAGGNLACASCHAEGNEDGRTWRFTCEGTRRTQSLHTGLKGTQPFHWGGDQNTFSTLMTNVFVGRMSGPQLTPSEGDTLFNWIDAQPRPNHAAPSDVSAVARGRSIFNSQQAACATCHMGDRLTNVVNGQESAPSFDVGTGGKFQVPSLIGIGTRGPFMHNGCAKTLGDRFDVAACGGGDNHGVTSNLTRGQVGDLVTFLKSL